MTRQEVRVEERKAPEMARGWLVWVNGRWCRFRAFGEPWRHMESGCTGPTALFELGEFVSLVETFARESTVLRLLEPEDEFESAVDALDAAAHAFVREQAAAARGAVEFVVEAGTMMRGEKAPPGIEPG